MICRCMLLEQCSICKSLKSRVRMILHSGASLMDAPIPPYLGAWQAQGWMHTMVSQVGEKLWPQQYHVRSMEASAGEASFQSQIHIAMTSWYGVCKTLGHSPSVAGWGSGLMGSIDAKLDFSTPTQGTASGPADGGEEGKGTRSFRTLSTGQGSWASVEASFTQVNTALSNSLKTA